jgi:hypothetical protein
MIRELTHSSQYLATVMQYPHHQSLHPPRGTHLRIFLKAPASGVFRQWSLLVPIESVRRVLPCKTPRYMRNGTK